jgi:3-methyladenine DNA glycosylase Mpg
MFQIDTTSADTIQGSFLKAADDLLNHHILVFGSRTFRIIEVEFYFHCTSGDHEDCYAHKHNEQLNNGTWYFHGSGLDITFGNGSDVHGGALIRSIEWLNPQGETKPTQTVIIGPLQIVTAIFASFKKVSDNSPILFYLHDLTTAPYDDVSRLQKEEVYSTTRIGLNEAKDTSPGKRFHKARYRFLIKPQLPHKEKTRIAESMYEKCKDFDHVKRIMGNDLLKHLR